MEQRITRITTANKQALNESIAQLGGRIPPQALDLERSVLGAMMLEKNAVTDSIDILRTDSFYDPRHTAVYKAIRDLFGSSQPIDLLTVANQLRKNGEMELVGASYLSSLVLKTASTSDVEHHAGVIIEKYILRQLIQIGQDVIKDAYDETKDVFEVLDKAGNDLFQVAENVISKSVEPIEHILQKAIVEIELASQNKDGISGVPSGFFELDKITAGWQPSDMIIVAARPAMGKTAFVLSMARNIAVDHGMGVAIFSLEMSALQLVKRLIASEAKISAENLRKGSVSEDDLAKIHKHVSQLKSAKLYIDDTPGLSVFDLRAKCRRLKLQHQVNIIIIDYLQLMNAGATKGGHNREQEISSISRSIKEIAKELNVPIIALSQLSRAVENRGGDKKPMLSDLRESGAIEQDADIVTFIHRPEYYGLTTGESGESLVGLGEVIIAKHRNGGLGTVQMRFVAELAKFENLEDIGYTNNRTTSTPQTVTYQSRMNDPDEDFLSDTDDTTTPF